MVDVVKAVSNRRKPDHELHMDELSSKFVRPCQEYTFPN